MTQMKNYATVGLKGEDFSRHEPEIFFPAFICGHLRHLRPALFFSVSSVPPW
jgi:hypothetical protein